MTKNPSTVIAIINQKGGCGKTTTAINLAASYSRQKKKTLIIDMDPQGHVSLGLNVCSNSLLKTIHSAMEPTNTTLKLRQCIVQVGSHLDLIPSNIKLASLEQLLHGKNRREFRLKDLLTPLVSKYEYIIIDSPPNLGLLSINAILASHQVIIPIEPSDYSLQGAQRLNETLDLLEEKTKHKVNRYCLMTMHWNSDTHSQNFYTKLFQTFGDQLLLSKVNFSQSLKSAAAAGKPVLYHNIADVTALDYLAVSDELEKRFAGIQIQHPSARKRKGRNGILGRITLLNSSGKVIRTINPQKLEEGAEGSMQPMGTEKPAKTKSKIIQPVQFVGKAGKKNKLITKKTKQKHLVAA
jgi:chromosome partitioning protein